MKLRNKLLSLTSLVAATGLVAPMVTSCGKNTTTVDITKPYSPTIAKADPLGSLGDEVSVEKAYNLYMNHVMANPEILKQDIWYYEAQKLPSRIQQIEYSSDYATPVAANSDSEGKTASVNNISANIYINNVEVKRHTVIIEGKETEFFSLSMDIGYEYEVEATSLSTEPRIQTTSKFTFNSKYNDIPLYMYFDFNRDWHVSIDLLDENIDDYLKELPGWYLTYEYSQDVVVKTTTNGLTQTSEEKSSNSDTITRRSQIYDIKSSDDQFMLATLADQYMDYASYHMQDVYAEQAPVALKTNITADLIIDSSEGYYAQLGEDSYVNAFDVSPATKLLNLQASYVTGKILSYDSDDSYWAENNILPIYGTLNDQSAVSYLRFGTSSLAPSIIPIDEDGNMYMAYARTQYSDYLAELTDETTFTTTIPAQSLWINLAWYNASGEVIKKGIYPLSLADTDSNVSFNIEAQPGRFNTDSWTNLITDINSVYNKTKTEAQFFADWPVKGNTQVDSWDDYIGQKRTVEINGLKHVVRVIGTQHDTLTDGSRDTALFTFELVTLLSDSNGDAITSKWDAENCFDFTNSILLKNLNSADSAVWGFDGTSTDKRSALQMLPTELQNAIKTVTKSTAISNDSGSNWSKKTYDTKLFPLSFTEANGTSELDEGGTLYNFYKDKSFFETKYYFKTCFNNNLSHWIYYSSTPYRQYNYYEGKYFYKEEVHDVYCINSDDGSIYCGPGSAKVNTHIEGEENCVSFAFCL